MVRASFPAVGRLPSLLCKGKIKNSRKPKTNQSRTGPAKSPRHWSQPPFRAHTQNIKKLLSIQTCTNFSLSVQRKGAVLDWFVFGWGEPERPTLHVCIHALKPRPNRPPPPPRPMAPRTRRDRTPPLFESGGYRVHTEMAVRDRTPPQASVIYQSQSEDIYDELALCIKKAEEKSKKMYLAS